MEASSSSSQKCSDTELDNKEQTTSERQVCGKTADLAINRDGEEHARIGNAKGVQDDGRKETVTYQFNKYEVLWIGLDRFGIAQPGGRVRGGCSRIRFLTPG